MIKRTLVISNKAFLFQKDKQLHISKEDEEPTVPIEDIGVLMLESHQATITQSALSALMANGTVVIGCDATHHPDGIMIPIAGHTLHTAVLKEQMNASEPLNKQLWQQTVKAKIENQASALSSLNVNIEPMDLFARKVRSGDPGNLEGRAATYYWKNFFPQEFEFVRDPEGAHPNNYLNYGYALLRAATARAIVSSGLHAAVGLHHRNQYNAFCLADDLMEPYRPFVDILVRELSLEPDDEGMLTPSVKKRLLGVLSMDAWMENERKPFLLALTATTSSLVKCYAKEARHLRYPQLRTPSGTTARTIE
jgi:CRISPR-associated protein Cas1